MANFICHTDNTDGFAAPCVLEVEDEESDIVEPDS